MNPIEHGTRICVVGSCHEPAAKRIKRNGETRVVCNEHAAGHPVIAEVEQ